MIYLSRKYLSMADIRQLIHQSIEIEGLLKVLLERDDPHAVEVLADRFDAFVQDMNILIRDRQASAAYVDPDLAEVKDQEAEESEVKPQDEAAAEAVEEGAEEPEKDDVTRRKEMPPLRSVLTLNDKFYFVRKVFGGNENDFDDTLEILDSMDTYAEAVEYITGDMMLDANDFGVRAFLDFLSKNMNP